VTHSDPLTATVGITGLDAGPNPHPGIATALALRADPRFRGRIVGLTYDPMINGAFAGDVLDAVALVPWPGDPEAWHLRALRQARERHGIDLALPCLDSEVPTYARLAGALRDAGIATLLPSEEAVKRRFKWNLPELCRRTRVDTPKTTVLYDAEQIHPLGGWSWPVYVKGALAGAEIAADTEEADYLFRSLAARWGYPVLLQERRSGVEYLLAGVSRRGADVTAFVAVKKARTTAAGKATAAVTVVDERLEAIGRRILDELDWRGPFELEFLHDFATGRFLLIEINARFPAWISFAPHVGQPLATDAVEIALGGVVPSRPRPEAGIHFVRTDRVTTGSVTAAAAIDAAIAAQHATGRKGTE